MNGYCFLYEALTCWGYAARQCIIDNTNLARLRGTGAQAVLVAEMEVFAQQFAFQFVCHEKGHPDRKTGRPREHAFRELVNAIFYLTKTGCQWRNLPEHFARWGTVYHYFRLWKRNGLWVAIHTHCREHVRVAAGRNRHPSAGIIDSQSVRSTECSDERGYDAGKKINGRKRHILVDTIGLLLLVTVLPANLQDRDGARQLLTGFFSQCQSMRRRVRHIWADGGYAGTLHFRIYRRHGRQLIPVLMPESE